jgi:hypothetical protein
MTVPPTFKRFDAADYIKDAADIAAYLGVVSEEGDAAHARSAEYRGEGARKEPIQGPVTRPLRDSSTRSSIRTPSA